MSRTVSFKIKYCKRANFRGGKISRKCWPGISRGGNFHDTTPISFITAYGFYFRVGVIFAKKTKREKRENYPHAKISTFTVSGAGVLAKFSTCEAMCSGIELGSTTISEIL